MKLAKKHQQRIAHLINEVRCADFTKRPEDGVNLAGYYVIKEDGYRATLALYNEYGIELASLEDAEKNAEFYRACYEEAIKNEKA